MQIFPYAIFQPIKPHIDVTHSLTSRPGLLLQFWCVDDLRFQNFPKRTCPRGVTKTKLNKNTFYLAYKCLWVALDMIQITKLHKYCNSSVVLYMCHVLD